MFREHWWTLSSRCHNSLWRTFNYMNAFFQQYTIILVIWYDWFRQINWINSNCWNSLKSSTKMNLWSRIISLLYWLWQSNRLKLNFRMLKVKWIIYQNWSYSKVVLYFYRYIWCFYRKMKEHSNIWIRLPLIWWMNSFLRGCMKFWGGNIALRMTRNNTKNA